MYLTPTDRRPAWYRDAKWLCGLLAVVSLAATLFFFSLSQLTSPAPSQAVLTNVLQYTLLPGGLDEPGLGEGFTAGLDYRPGEPFAPLPGVGFTLSPEALETISAAEVRAQLARALTDAFIAEGLEGALELVSEPQLMRQLTEVVQGPLLETLNAQLERSMLPAGLSDGSRMANWRQQRAFALGQPVQPIVGVFVLVPPSQLEGSTPAQIGELIVAELSRTVVEEGLNEARALVTNPNLLQRLTETVEGEGRALAESFFSALLIAQEPVIEARLEEVRERLAAPEQEAMQIEGLQLGADVTGLSPQEANERVLEQLAGVVYDRGIAGALELSVDAQQSQRLGQALTPFSSFTREQHRSYHRLSWLFGALSLLFIVLVLVFSAGLMRLFNLGLIVALAALAGAALFWTLAQGLPASPPPASVEVSEGVLGYLQALARYLGSSLPNGALETVARSHLVVLAVGVGLMALYVLLQLVRALRPRRARF
jgi:hypothetical protein